ncbi:unnamed protein product [Rhizophagus irregularis]|nr:unnamed protein product [Rhizophagus irregularis]
MAYIESLKEIILDENFTIIKFFRKIDLPFIQRNKRKTWKASDYATFNERKRRTGICHVRSNVLNEHIIESDKIIAGKRKSTDGYPPSKDHSPPSILPSDFNHDHANCEEDIEPEYYDARKRHKIRYSWEDVIEKVDFRDSSKKDWILQGYNLSDEFRNFQQQTIQQVKLLAKHRSARDSLASKVKDIICLSNIMMIERTKPSYFTCKSNDWNTICQRQPLSSVANSVILEYSSLLNSFTPLDKIQKKWCANFSRITELNDQDIKWTKIIFAKFTKFKLASS